MECQISNSLVHKVIPIPSKLRDPNGPLAFFPNKIINLYPTHIRKTNAAYPTYYNYENLYFQKTKLTGLV